VENINIVKEKAKEILNKIKNKFKLRLVKADAYTIIAFLIFFFTTLTLNVYVAMYSLSLAFFLLGYLTAKGGKHK